MAADVTVSVNTHGLGSSRIYSEDGSNYREVHFYPNIGVKISYEYHYTYTVTYKPGYGREPRTYDGYAHWPSLASMVFPDADCQLIVPCEAGESELFESVDWKIDVLGDARYPISFTVDPSESVAHYIWAYRRQRYRDSEEYDIVWKLKRDDDDYSFETVRLFQSGGTYTEIRREEFSAPGDGVSYVIAYYEKPHITVYFDAKGGVVNPSSKSVYIGQRYGTLPTPTYEGKKFVGWFDEDDNEVTATDVVIKTEDHTLYAKWEDKKIKVTVVPYDKTHSRYVEFGTAEVGDYSFDPDDEYEEQTEGEKHMYIYTIDYGRRCALDVWDNGTTLRLYDITLPNFDKYENGTWITPEDDLTLKVNFVSRNREFTYLPLYNPTSEILLRGVKTELLLRDGDG